MLDIKKMKTLREGLGLSQADAAKKAGMGGGRQQWGNIETGAKVDIALSTLDKIAKALGVKSSQLLK